MTLCTFCEASLECPLVCTSCNSFQDVREEPSPFATLGLETAWEVAPKELKRRLLKFSRFVHPDYFVTSDEETREKAERASAALNASFEVLSNSVSRADWLVESLGGPKESEERQMPQPFLMQVMEWNETLEEAREAKPDSPAWQAVEALSHELASERDERLQAISALLTPLPEAGSEGLTTARREINSIRYIDRAQNELKSLQLKAALGGQS